MKTIWRALPLGLVGCWALSPACSSDTTSGRPSGKNTGGAGATSSTSTGSGGHGGNTGGSIGSGGIGPLPPGGTGGSGARGRAGGLDAGLPPPTVIDRTGGKVPPDILTKVTTGGPNTSG